MRTLIRPAKYLSMLAALALSVGCVSTGPGSKTDAQKGSHRAMMIAVVPNYLSKFMCADPAYRRCFGLEKGVCESQMRRYGRACEEVVFPPSQEYYTRADLQDVGVRYGRCVMDTHRKVSNKGVIDDAQCLALMPRKVDSRPAALRAVQPQSPSRSVNTTN